MTIEQRKRLAWLRYRKGMRDYERFYYAAMQNKPTTAGGILHFLVPLEVKRP